MKKINTIPRDNMENCTEQMSEDTPNTNKDPIDSSIYIRQSKSKSKIKSMKQSK